MSSETLRRPADEGVREMPTVYHIPVCPFSQRLEVLLALEGLGDRVAFHVVDITRPEWLREKTRGRTALPILETTGGGIVKESMVILRYLEDVFPGPPSPGRTPTGTPWRTCWPRTRPRTQS